MPCPQLRIALFFESLKMAHGHELFLLYLGEGQKPRGKFVKAFFWENTCALCPRSLNPGIIRIEKPAFLYSNISIRLNLSNIPEKFLLRHNRRSIYELT